MPTSRTALAAAFALLACATVQAAPACTPPRQVIERFIPADCEACWAGAGGSEALPASAWVLDWIAPGARGDEAALSVAALPEAAARLAEIGEQPLGETSASRRDWPLPRQTLVRLSVAAGPAWNGYFGLELRTRGRAPPGAQAYLALVEQVPAGSDGTAVARSLVRAVAGPLPLAADGRASRTLRALRIADNAKPERLQGMAWWVNGKGRLLGVAREGCPAAPRP